MENPCSDVAAKELTDSSPYIERSGDNSVENAVFLLSAPNSFWLLKTDWVQGPIPGNLVINYRNNKHLTPLVQRLKKLHKTAKRKHTGANFKDPTYLNNVNHAVVLRGELNNEAVSGGEGYNLERSLSILLNIYI